MISLSVKNLNVTFQSGNHKVEAVKNAGFEVRQGDVYGLVGESGSGKSTLLRSIAGLVPEISGGAIYFEGKLLSRKRSFEFYKNVQMVFQDPYGSLHPRHTVDVTLMEPLKINKFDNKDRRIEEALENVGLDRSYRFRYPHELSGGQRQRVSIARAIIMEPRILLLDEPTSALDVSVQAEILNLLRRLRKEMDLTMILVSHNLAVVSHMCDEMSVMNKGEIVEQMKVEQLRKQNVETDYTKQLLKAAGGYDKDFLETPAL